MKKLYLLTRDLHLYLGLFISPFVLVFAISVVFLVHAFIPGVPPENAVNTRKVANLPLPPNIESLSGRPRIEALRGALAAAGVPGEVGFVMYYPEAHSLEIPVTVPGRESTVAIDVKAHSAVIEERTTGIWDAMVKLHKLPGPHLTEIRMNWVFIGLWRWFADATVYLLLFLSISGIYMWYVLRAERRIGMVLLSAGTFFFVGVMYALCR